MYFVHNSVHAGHYGSLRMYSSLRLSYYWSNIAGEVQDSVANYQSYLRTKGARYKLRREFGLFPATEPLRSLCSTNSAHCRSPSLTMTTSL